MSIGALQLQEATAARRYQILRADLSSDATGVFVFHSRSFFFRLSRC